MSTPGRASQVVELHDYTSICSSALSEVVALVILRNKERCAQTPREVAFLKAFCDPALY